MNCVVCDKRIKRGTFRWTLTWDRDNVDGGRAWATRSFEVSFHNTPECLRGVTGRLDGYAFDQQMAKVVEASESYVEAFDEDKVLVPEKRKR